MTKTGKKPHWRDVAESFFCRTCGAGPGDSCRTFTGNRTLTPHTDRTGQAAANGWQFPEDFPPDE